MTSGFQWNEDDVADYNLWIASDDHVQYLLDRPPASPPGTPFTRSVVPARDLAVVATVEWRDLTETTPLALAEQVLGVIVRDVVAAAS
jgi:hypothetical protein